MAKVLYISYTGLLDPLGESQVLQYLIGLSKEHEITLLTFEKPKALRETSRLDALSEQCRAAGIDWRRLIYHNRLGIPATIWDILTGIRLANRLAAQKHSEIVHCRSYIAGIIGLAVKRKTGAKFVFDMRGFWPDERADAGIWSRGSARYRFFKRVERRLFSEADHVVSLTRAGAEAFLQFDYLKDAPPPVSVIPTCTNLNRFSVRAAGEGAGFTLGYVGSAGSWYLFKEVAQTVRLLFERYADARFLVVNQGDHGKIRQVLAEAGVDNDRVEIHAVPYDEVPLQIAAMDAGIFFIKPVFSKQASCPTKMGEFLGCGKPCLANAGVGDVAEDLHETGTGIAVSAFDEATLAQAVVDLVALAKESGISKRCRKAAVERFSLKTGVAEYSRIYKQLTASPIRAAAE